jgi:thioredoxin reductase (NADPH)
MAQVFSAIIKTVMAEKILTPDMKEILKESFSHLKEEVTFMVFTKKGTNEQFNEMTTALIKELSSLEPKLKAEFHGIGDEASRKYDAARSPTLLISPNRYKIRFTGAPLGEEGRSLIMTAIMASTGRTILSEASRKKLQRLKDQRHVRVFVSPTCPYCPQQVLYAVSAAILRSDLVSTEVIEIYENRDLAEEYAAMSVPKTFVGETLTASGLEPEEYFIESIIQGAPAANVMPEEREELRDYDVAILGGGPAGLTAAIYVERSGLKSIIFERANVGGQIAITPIVENYPGFQRIAGKTLVEMMAQHAMDYAPLLQGVGVEDIKKKDGAFEVHTGRGVYTAKAVILATGATYRTLEVPGEKRLSGRGVSYCATCDGYLFKDGKNVLVVGGGDSALTDALYLDSIGAHVTLVHRRDALRAEARLQQSLFQRNIPVLWNSRVVEIKGERVVEKVRVEDVKTGKATDVKVDGVFIAIGYQPNNEIAKKMGLELNKLGYIKVDSRQRTSMPLVYAAGDVTGGEKQIAVAAGQGSGAAIAAFEDISSPYWKKQKEPGGEQ